ncbi:hypothetical protein Tco_1424447, partial [Tanacetum coccineum]
ERPVNTASTAVNTGSTPSAQVNTGSTPSAQVNTAEVNTAELNTGETERIQRREGKAPMTEEDLQDEVQASKKSREQELQELAGLEAAQKLQATMDAETQRQIDLDALLARRLVEQEEEAAKEALATEFNYIQAKLNADQILTEKIQQEEREQYSIEDRAKCMSPSPTAGLVPKSVLAAPYVPPTNKELEILLQPMFDEHFETPSIEQSVPPDPAVQVLVFSAGTPSSTTIDQDAPSTSHLPSSSEVQPPISLQGVAVDCIIDDNPFTQAVDGPFENVFAPEL